MFIFTNNQRFSNHLIKIKNKLIDFYLYRGSKILKSLDQKQRNKLIDVYLYRGSKLFNIRHQYSIYHSTPVSLFHLPINSSISIPTTIQLQYQQSLAFPLSPFYLHSHELSTHQQASNQTSIILAQLMLQSPFSPKKCHVEPRIKK